MHLDAWNIEVFAASMIAAFYAEACAALSHLPMSTFVGASRHLPMLRLETAL